MSCDFIPKSYPYLASARVRICDSNDEISLWITFNSIPFLSLTLYFFLSEETHQKFFMVTINKFFSSFWLWRMCAKECWIELNSEQLNDSRTRWVRWTHNDYVWISRKLTVQRAFLKRTVKREREREQRSERKSNKSEILSPNSRRSKTQKSRKDVPKCVFFLLFNLLRIWYK